MTSAISRCDDAGQRRGTPRWFVAALREHYDIRLDVCAEPHTAIADWSHTREDDGLASTWDTDDGRPGGWAYCNPPWRNVEPWLQCAATWRERGQSSLVLLKCDPGTQWFQRRRREATMIYLITPRLNYLDPETMRVDGGITHNSCLWVYDGKDGHHDNTATGPLVMRYWHLPRPHGAH